MPHRFRLIDRNQPSGMLFLRMFPDFTLDSNLAPADFMMRYWGEYTHHARAHNLNNSMNGAIFELLFSALLINKRLTPFYIQSNVAFVPNVRYDILFYTEEYGPVGISLKTSLRERYKQADLEAYVLKNVHRKSISFIVTANAHEATSVNQKIADGDLLALNHVFSLEQVNELVNFLSELTIIEPPAINVVSGRIIQG